MLLLLPDLYTGISFDRFQSVGYTPVDIERLMMVANGTAITDEQSLNSEGGISSRPVDFFQFKCLSNCFSICIAVTLLNLKVFLVDGVICLC